MTGLRRILIAVCIGAAAAAAADLRAAAPAGAPSERRPQEAAAPRETIGHDVADHQQLLNRYCITCHNQRARTGGLALDGRSLTSVGADAEIWEKVVVKLRAGLMPPVGRPRPDQGSYDAFTAWLENELDRAAAGHPDPGVTPLLHRLNRTEYQNAMRDLLDLQVDVTAMLPADDASYGFDNSAGVLRMSPTLMERYLAAAEKVSRLAVGSPAIAADAQIYRLPDDLSQERHIDGLPFGTRGGTRIRHTFPVDGEYVVKVRLARDFEEYVPVWADDQRLEVSIDGRRVQLFTAPGVVTEPETDKYAVRPARPAGRSAAPRSAADEKKRRDEQERQEQEENRVKQARKKIDAAWDVRVPITAGVHDVTVAFLEKTAALAETVKAPFARPYAGGFNYLETRTQAYLRTVEISGPFAPARGHDSESRRRIFSCRPADPAQEAPCARTILSTLARRAYRRPVTDADLDVLLRFYGVTRAGHDFDEAIEVALERLLVSPEFLFRIESEPARGGAAGVQPSRISDLELASRLSFFLWSSLPDDELLETASRGQLRDPAVLERQTRRMLADARSEALVTNFAGQWLYLRNLPGVIPIQFVYPDFDEALRQGFRRETELFFENLVREDRSVMELLTADYTFVDERLARHYGIPNVKGGRFRKVTLPDEARRGLLGQGSILTVTSYPQRTSPVLRGKWILENFLGTPPPPPPPNVPDLKERNDRGAVLSMREQMELHRANPSCASCHAMMDPLGFALETFDGVGRYRTLDARFARIDASGVFPDGSRIDGPAGLRRALLKHSDRFITTVTQKLMTYALGRGVEYYDAPAIRAIAREAARDDYRFSSIVLGIVKSPAFQLRKPQS